MNQFIRSNRLNVKQFLHNLSASFGENNAKSPGKIHIPEKLPNLLHYHTSVQLSNIGESLKSKPQVFEALLSIMSTIGPLE